MKITTDIIIPILNEENTLEGNVGIIIDFLKKELSDNYDCRVILADNGSDDNTPAIGKKLAEKFSGVVFYHRVGKKGVGLALKSSWLESDAQYVGYMDLDMATDLRHLTEALEALGSNDVVYGSRLHKSSKVIGRTLKREITSRIFNLFIKTYLRTHFSDGMCGFKFLKKEHVESIIDSGADSDGWFFCTEILVVSEWLGLKLYELPVEWTDDPNSKVKIGKLALEYIGAMQRLKNRHIS